MDDYFHYIWIIHFRAKSDFIDVYLAFESYVQRKFDKIITGEFVKNRLSSHSQQHRFFHQVFFPYTPE